MVFFSFFLVKNACSCFQNPQEQKKVYKYHRQKNCSKIYFNENKKRDIFKINYKYLIWFFFSEMDPIFRNDTQLKKECKKLINEILPSLNICGNCNCFKCQYCSKFSVSCSFCISSRSRICVEFSKTKDTLINSNNAYVSIFITDFLIDYFRISDISKEFFKLEIDERLHEKNPLILNNEKNKSTINYKKEKESKKIVFQFKGKKRQWHKKNICKY